MFALLMACQFCFWSFFFCFHCFKMYFLKLIHCKFGHYWPFQIYFKVLTVSLIFELHGIGYCLVLKFSQVKRNLSCTKLAHCNLLFLILPILGSWNQTVELLFHFGINLSRLKSQMTDKFYWVDFSHRTTGGPSLQSEELFF